MLSFPPATTNGLRPRLHSPLLNEHASADLTSFTFRFVISIVIVDACAPNETLFIKFLLSLPQNSVRFLLHAVQIISSLFNVFFTSIPIICFFIQRMLPFIQSFSLSSNIVSPPVPVRWSLFKSDVYLFYFHSFCVSFLTGENTKTEGHLMTKTTTIDTCTSYPEHICWH